MPVENKQLDGPVLIIGVMPRSGTNYLHKSLLLHPNCKNSAINGEDFVVYNSKSLVEYINQTHKKNKRWNNQRENLILALENGLSEYLGMTSLHQGVTVAKTPHPNGLFEFSQLFKTFRIIILTRDGKDTVESFVNTFGSTYDFAIRKWVRGAHLIDKTLALRLPNVIQVKYEDLILKESKTLKKVFNFLQLDESKYPFDRQVGVIGSSQLNDGTVMWNKEFKKTTDFNPLSRSSSWSKWIEWRFEWLASLESKSLGYHNSNNYRLNPLFWFFNMIYDFKFAMLSTVKWIRDIAKSTFDLDKN